MDADTVMDVRFLPNPHWVDELRPHTGQHPAVRDFVLGQDGAAEFLDTYHRLLGVVIEGYRREGKRYMTVAIGCTGGKHRSVAMAEALAGRLACRRPPDGAGAAPGSGARMSVTHRRARRRPRPVRDAVGARVGSPRTSPRW